VFQKRLHLYYLYYVGDKSLFSAHPVEEQIEALGSSKVGLPSGGSFVIDGSEKVLNLSFGSLPVRLPDWPTPLRLVALKGFFGVPDFRYYAIADGIREIMAGRHAMPFAFLLPARASPQLSF
jgi:hypothetical protein